MADDYVPLLERVTRKINEKQFTISNQLSAGQAKDYADYKRMVGQIRGLADAKDIVNEELKKESQYE